jgi:hypothetical protein
MLTGSFIIGAVATSVAAGSVALAVSDSLGAQAPRSAAADKTRQVDERTRIMEWLLIYPTK